VTTPSSPKADAGIAPIGRYAAYLAELIGTFGLVLFIVLALSVSAPAPIGLGGPDFSVVGLVHAFAPAIYGGFGPLGDWLLAFVVGPLAGAVAVAHLYTALGSLRGSRPVTAHPAAAPAPSAQLGVTRP
jgi:hypothetical protein